MSLHIGIIADLLKLPLENSIIRCAELGAKGVQLYAVKGEMKPENMSSEKIAHIRELLVNNGLGFQLSAPIMAGQVLPTHQGTTSELGIQADC